MKASVRVMLSYDYNHFEVCLGSDDGEPLSVKESNELRKTAQRLADEAVRQFKVAKERAFADSHNSQRKADFLRNVHAIQAKEEASRSIEEMAILKQYEDNNWEAQFEDRYDYDDDFNGEV